MSLLTILLQAVGGSQQWSGILMMVVIVAIFYFFMIRPQQKKQKEKTLPIYLCLLYYKNPDLSIAMQEKSLKFLYNSKDKNGRFPLLPKTEQSQMCGGECKHLIFGGRIYSTCRSFCVSGPLPTAHFRF